jgi:predicted metal-dependent phosphoesterase TrpH
MLAGDFHVHSFPGDGVLPPWDIAHEAARRGLDVVGLTNHNHTLSWRLASIVPWDHRGAMLIPGVELTSTHYHMASIGITRPVAWNQSAADAARAIQQAGGVAIAAHPAGRGRVGLDDAAVDAIDGFEAAHPLMDDWPEGAAQLAQFRNHALGRRPRLAQIGSTDFHTYAPIGFCRTFVFVTGVSSQGVLEAIRAGRTVACDAHGRTYGPDDLARVAADACVQAVGAPALDASWTGSLGAAAVWLGLLALVIAGADER